MAQQIPRRYVEGYVDGLQRIDALTKQALANALSNVDWDAPVASVREQLIAVMRPVAYQARSTAAQLAASFYDGLREYMLGDPLGAIGIDGYSDHELERAVRASVAPLTELDGWDQVADEMESRLRSEAEARVAAALSECIGRSVREAAGGTLYGNGERDQRRPRYARVPGGSRSYPEGCPFCRMLASRGFVYRSRESAGGLDPDHYHDGCSCAVVPAWGSGSVEGYDPDDYLDGYAEYMAQDHSEHEANVRATQRNRYRDGRLRSGTGERVDRKRRLTDADRARIRRERSAAATETRRTNRRLRGGDRWLENVGVWESDWREMDEAQQQALLNASRRADSSLAASRNYFMQDDDLYERVKKMAPEPGYEGHFDVGIHSDGYTFANGHIGHGGELVDQVEYSVAEIAELVRTDPDYNGGPIRLVACYAGRYPDGAAQQLANELGVDVRAPDMEVFVDFDGRYRLARGRYENRLIIRGEVEESGHWITFHPNV